MCCPVSLHFNSHSWSAGSVRLVCYSIVCHFWSEPPASECDAAQRQDTGLLQNADLILMTNSLIGARPCDDTEHV